METRCDLCGRKGVDWRRPPVKKAGLEHAGYRCDDCTPDWRVLEFEPLSKKAEARKAEAERAALPNPKKGGK